MKSLRGFKKNCQRYIYVGSPSNWFSDKCTKKQYGTDDVKQGVLGSRRNMLSKQERPHVFHSLMNNGTRIKVWMADGQFSHRQL